MKKSTETFNKLSREMKLFQPYRKETKRKFCRKLVVKHIH